MTAQPRATICPGFSDPPLQSQAVFRALLSAMSRPGLVVPCPALIADAPMPPVMAAVALSLLDYESPVHLCGRLNAEEPRSFFSFHTGAPFVAAAHEAAFVIALAPSDLPPISSLAAGTPAYPDRSATVLLGVDNFVAGPVVTLSGPGIQNTRPFSATGLSAAFWEAAAENAAGFPLGVDFIFCGPREIAALPRSTVPSLAETREGLHP